MLAPMYWLALDSEGVQFRVTEEPTTTMLELAVSDTIGVSMGGTACMRRGRHIMLVILVVLK